MYQGWCWYKNILKQEWRYLNGVKGNKQYFTRKIPGQIYKLMARLSAAKKKFNSI